MLFKTKQNEYEIKKVENLFNDVARINFNPDDECIYVSIRKGFIHDYYKESFYNEIQWVITEILCWEDGINILDTPLFDYLKWLANNIDEIQELTNILRDMLYKENLFGVS